MQLLMIWRGGGGGHQTKELNQIVKVLDSSVQIRVLKTDVDGFDYDVINSSLEVIKNYKPLIFFECQYDYEYQFNGYLELLDTLRDLDYINFVVFDNFGAVILRSSDIFVLKSLMNYIWFQNIGISSRTVYYLDILCINAHDNIDIDNLLGGYKEFVNKRNDSKLIR